MRLGPLNVLLTALESNESRHTSEHFVRIPNAAMSADTNVHLAESFGSP